MSTSPEVRKRYREAHPDRVAEGKLDWKRRNPEKHRANNRASWLRTNYGITVEQYDAMTMAQSGCCWICRCSPPEDPGTNGNHRLVVDHDHDTGVVRGLLCRPCNAALGVLEANLDRVKEYLDGA